MPAATLLRDDVTALTRLAEQDLSVLWRDITEAAQARTALMDVLPALIETYGSAAATLASDWYDEAREEAGVPRRFSAIPVEPGDRGAQSLVGWAVDRATDVETLQTLLLGGLQRRIADHSRETIMGSALEDPGAKGWSRGGKGGCTSGFCDLLIARGAVYSEATADFASHDHCQCYAVPAFDGEPRPVKAYTPTLRNVSDADRARVRDYLRTH